MTSFMTMTVLKRTAFALTALTAASSYAMLPNPTDQKNQPIAGVAASTASPLAVSTATAQSATQPVAATAQVTPAQAVQTTAIATNAAVKTATAPAVSPMANAQAVQSTQATKLAVQSQVPPLGSLPTQTASQMPSNTQTVTANIQGNTATANVASVGQMTLNQNNQDVSSAIFAYVVQGNTLTPVTTATQLKSGDVVEYQGYFTNVSPDHIRTMTAMMTVPDGMEFVGSQEPNFAFASMDGSHFARIPLKANMNGVVQDLPLSMYKALRWDIEDVGLQGTAVVKYRAKVK